MPLRSVGPSGEKLEAFKSVQRSEVLAGKVGRIGCLDDLVVYSWLRWRWAEGDQRGLNGIERVPRLKYNDEWLGR